MKARQYNYKQDYYYGIDYFPERLTYRNSNGVEVSEFEIKTAIAKREKRNGGCRGLIAIGNELIGVESESVSSTFESSPINKDFLLETWEEWKKPVIDKYQRRNERLFDREIERISRYYDDFALKTQDRIKKYEEEKNEVIRKKDNSSDFAEREKYRKRIQDIDILLGRLNLQVYKERSEGEKKREKEQKELRDKLDLKFQEEMIAITHFTIR